LRDLIKGKLSTFEGTGNAVGLPADVLERVLRAEVEAERMRTQAEVAQKTAAAKELQLEKTALLLARRAATAAREGRIEEARQDFAIITDATNNIDILLVAGQFFYQVGEFERAGELLRRVLSITGPDGVADQAAGSLEVLGFIAQRRGDLAQAETMHRKALAIYEALGQPQLIARHYSKNELLQLEHHDFDKAEEMRRKALETNERLGRKLIECEVSPSIAIPDNDPQGLASMISIAEFGTIEAILVRVGIKHTYIGDLRVELVAPTGRVIVLHNRTGGPTDNLSITYSPDSLPALTGLNGQEVNGQWILRARDLTSMDTGRLDKWGLELTYTPRLPAGTPS
jgi:subtilisin-like proprotein convertase family protein